MINKPKNRLQIRNRYVMGIDILFIIVSVIGSYTLRLELDSNYYSYMPFAFWMIGLAVVVKPMVYYFFGLYRRLWIYASMEELKLILVAVTTASVPLLLAMVLLHSFGVFVGFPRAVFVIDWLLSMTFVGGLRFTIRILAENQSNGRAERSDFGVIHRTLIVGAGDAGALVVRELQKNPQLNLYPVCFLDDNIAKQQQQIYGVPIAGTISDLEKKLDDSNIHEVIIAIPSAPGRVVRMVANICRVKNVPFRTMPGLYELLGGKVSVNRLREVDITDLLRREPVPVQEELVGATLNGRVILVTGAGGSIGRELCRQIARWGPSLLIMLGHGENSIFEAVLELKENFPGLAIQPVIADIRDQSRMDAIFKQIRPQIVFHAAAHKHVPLMEANVEEAVTNNIMGTRNVVDVCLKYDVHRLVMISTDKAIRPINVMGATKRIAEMIVLDAAYRSGCAYSVVRFGNVLGSRGSVVPLFKAQIAHGGPVTITHPDMKRYFMTIPEAVHLVLQAAGMGHSGEVFVLNMGEQVRILDLAEDLIRLSGLEPGKDIEIVFSGIRPGEKLSEDLWDADHTYQVTSHPDIFKMGTANEDLTGQVLRSAINEMIRLAHEGDAPTIMAMMDELIPTASVCSTPPVDYKSIE